MYKNFYGFKEAPFALTPDPDFLFLSTTHRQALAYLNYGLVEKKGFIQITGEVGTGKTTLIRKLLREVKHNTKTAYIINPSAEFEPLLHNILSDLEVERWEPNLTKPQMLMLFNDFLVEQRQQGNSVAVILDEAQNLDISTLEEIRLLSNFETDKEKLLQIIMVGQPELSAKLNFPALRQLRQRIAVRFHLRPLNLAETVQYIFHRLQVAGDGNSVRFTESACKCIYEYSNGIPRLINIACDAVLLTGYVEEIRTFDESIVKGVIAELLEPVSASNSAEEHSLFDSEIPTPPVISSDSLPDSVPNAPESLAEIVPFEQASPSVMPPDASVPFPPPGEAGPKDLASPPSTETVKIPEEWTAYVDLKLAPLATSLDALESGTEEIKSALKGLEAWLANNFVIPDQFADMEARIKNQLNHLSLQIQKMAETSVGEDRLTDFTEKEFPAKVAEWKEVMSSQWQELSARLEAEISSLSAELSALTRKLDTLPTPTGPEDRKRELPVFSVVQKGMSELQERMKEEVVADKYIMNKIAQVEHRLKAMENILARRKRGLPRPLFGRLKK